MSQTFNVLQCYACCTFQVHQVKKLPKWSCKLCGQKQSLKQVFCQGSGKECRLYVQQLNLMQGQTNLDKLQVSNTQTLRGIQDVSADDANFETEKYNPISVSRWADFLETEVRDNNDCNVHLENLHEAEVVPVRYGTEKPRKRKTCDAESFKNLKPSHTQNEEVNTLHQKDYKRVKVPKLHITSPMTESFQRQASESFSDDLLATPDAPCKNHEDMQHSGDIKTSNSILSPNSKWFKYVSQ